MCQQPQPWPVVSEWAARLTPKSLWIQILNEGNSPPAAAQDHHARLGGDGWLGGISGGRLCRDGRLCSASWLQRRGRGRRREGHAYASFVRHRTPPVSGRVNVCPIPKLLPHLITEWGRMCRAAARQGVAAAGRQVPLPAAARGECHPAVAGAGAGQFWSSDRRGSHISAATSASERTVRPMVVPGLLKRCGRFKVRRWEHALFVLRYASLRGFGNRSRAKQYLTRPRLRILSTAQHISLHT